MMNMATTMKLTALVTTLLASSVSVDALGGTPGGWSTTELTPALQQLLLDAMTKNESNYAAELKARVCVTAVDSVEQQVVSGMNYRFHVRGCAVDSIKRAGWCAGNDAECKTKEYEIQIYEQSWTNTLQVSDITEEKSAKKEELKVEAASEATLSEEEKAQVDEWIEDNGLNKYGDKKGTMYTGGTPLFSESTGKTVDRYEYILRKHPDHPWLKNNGPGKARSSTALNLAAAETTTARSHSSGYAMVFGTLGVLTALVALVALGKARRSRRRFNYDSLSQS
ncbi:hypothetical protein Poli38472_002725 [Pythium oligandrum]|uniref:Uncharacterized protein n=1 Tax=Pythium oligandrum TaxID=41045 RepID=A0A8K1CIP9_PYTOL|nr:hypothetical protein Poli38472_002725 [Pythium oligandrum]|eukprot:TMW63784.1 hypothetical protein Poli38472_002725 [Pythium oligandrum]